MPLSLYVGSHGDAGAQRADVVLLALLYTEKSATYVNTEGRAQMTTRALRFHRVTQEKITIIRACRKPGRNFAME
jgi:NADH-quinone oxidoreductase subunit G